MFHRFLLIIHDKFVIDKFIFIILIMRECGIHIGSLFDT